MKGESYGGRRGCGAAWVAGTPACAESGRYPGGLWAWLSRRAWPHTSSPSRRPALQTRFPPFPVRERRIPRRSFWGRAASQVLSLQRGRGSRFGRPVLRCPAPSCSWVSHSGAGQGWTGRPPFPFVDKRFNCFFFSSPSAKLDLLVPDPNSEGKPTPRRS